VPDAGRPTNAVIVIGRKKRWSQKPTETSPQETRVTLVETVSFQAHGVIM